MNDSTAKMGQAENRVTKYFYAGILWELAFYFRRLLPPKEKCGTELPKHNKNRASPSPLRTILQTAKERDRVRLLSTFSFLLLLSFKFSGIFFVEINSF